MDTKDESTLIPVKRVTAERLKQNTQHMDETYDMIINRVLDKGKFK